MPEQLYLKSASRNQKMAKKRSGLNEDHSNYKHTSHHYELKATNDGIWLEIGHFCHRVEYH